MRALVLIIGLALAGAVHAEPDAGTHVHCWHDDGTRPPNEPAKPWQTNLYAVCCHCAVKRHCLDHGPHKPGCEPEPVLRISPYGFSPALMPVAP